MSKETDESRLGSDAEQSVEEVSRHKHWGRTLFFICIGILVLGAVSFQLMSKLSGGSSSKQSEVLSSTKQPEWHLRVKDFPEKKILLGFVNNGHVFMDASEFCIQPGFRPYAMDDAGLMQRDGLEGLALIKAPEIRLPANLPSRAWTVVSESQPAARTWFDMAYQWLGVESNNNACLFLGQKEAAKTSLDKFLPNPQPAIGLLGFDVKSDLSLTPSGPLFEVTPQNRDAALVEFPWLQEWMKAYATSGVKECGTEGEFHERVAIFPLEGKVFASGPTAKHWIAATGCETLLDWSLVVTTHERIEFVPLGRHKEEYDYGPGKVWTVDIDGDGNMEFLFDARYYEGSRYVLLKLKQDEKLGWRFNEIAGTAYEGL